MPRTKIVCTIGPATREPEVVRELLRAGMDVARINFSHGDHEIHARSIDTVRSVAQDEGRLVAVMADLQGPKLRVGDLPSEGVELEEGKIVTLADAPFEPGRIPLPHPEVLSDLRDGQRILLDDGQLELACEHRDSGGLRCRVVVGGLLRSKKGVNVPSADLHISTLTRKDRRDVRFAIEQAVDFLALSFVRTADDIKELRWLMSDIGSEIPIIAKIEKPEALDAFEEILAVTDGVMVARGDLGVETPTEEVPFHQKRIIRECNLAGKPVITATQMLQSMMERPTPTRAEASDVVNAILDGTDAVMLSGETAVGDYPVEVTRTMAKICSNAEAHLPLGQFLYTTEEGTSRRSVAEAISQATVEISAEVHAKAIITSTMSGATARLVARHRPGVPVIAVTPNEKTVYQLALVWGAAPVLISHFGTTDEMFELMVKAAHEKGFVSRGDRVVLTAGIPFGGAGITNMLKVHVVGESGEV